MTIKQYIYPAHFVDEDNGSVSVFFPDLEGCHTYDDTLEGAALMAKEALEGYIEAVIETGGTLPKPTRIRDININDGRVMYVIAELKNFLPQNTLIEKMVTAL